MDAELNVEYRIVRQSSASSSPGVPTHDYSIPDPELSKLGEQQCSALEQNLRDKLPLAIKVEVIVTSPMRRTLQTTSIGLDWLLKKGVPMELDPLWQENSDKPCDTGSPATRLKELFPNIDFSDLDPVFPNKGLETPYAFKREKVVRRGQTCLKNLYKRKEKVIAVVSHAGFLRCAISHTRYANADYRIFDFAPDTDAEKPELVEWSLTADNGGGMGKSEKGRAEIDARDFPTEKTEEVASKLGEKTDSEAAKEIP